LFLEGAGKLGIKLVNIGAQDIINQKHDIVLGVVWQLIRFHLLQGVDFDGHPELIRLMEKGETLSGLLHIGPENMYVFSNFYFILFIDDLGVCSLLRWINYHLRRAGSTKKVVNFSESLKDGDALTVLLGQVAPKQVEQSQVNEILALKDAEAKLKALLVRRFLFVLSYPKLKKKVFL